MFTLLWDDEVAYREKTDFDMPSLFSVITNLMNLHLSCYSVIISPKNVFMKLF